MVELGKPDEIVDYGDFDYVIMSCYITNETAELLLGRHKNVYDSFKNEIESYLQGGEFALINAVLGDPGLHLYSGKYVWKLIYQGQCNDSDMCIDLQDIFGNLGNTLDGISVSHTDDTPVLSDLFVQTLKYGYIVKRIRRLWE